jgi:hypothetical protein
VQNAHLDEVRHVEVSQRHRLLFRDKQRNATKQHQSADRKHDGSHSEIRNEESLHHADQSGDREPERNRATAPSESA